MRSSEVLLSV